MRIAMVRSNKSFVRIAVTLWILLFAYLVATVFKSTLWGNLLSPINAFAVSGVLLFTYLKTDHESKIRVTFLFYSLAAFMWGVGDIMCALLPIMGIDTSKRFVVSLAYTISNCLIIVALLIFSYRQFHKWNGIQLGIDILTVGFLFIYFVWIVYLHKDFALLWGIFGNDYTSIFSLLCDIFIVIGITTCLLSVRSGNLPFFIKVLSLGPIMFAIVDMLYYYYVFNNSIVSNSLTDFLYIVSLQVMAFGALWKTYKDPALFSFTELTNRGSKRSWIYMLIFPLSAVALEILGMPRLNVTIWDILLYAFVIFIYGNSCKYVQLSIENERLLAYVIHTNRELEVNAAAQVSKLSFLENQDPLTALYNRRYFMSCIDDAIGCHRMPS